MGLPHVLAWFGLMVLAILNGGARDRLYGPHLSERTAHQISTVALLIVHSLFLALLVRVWPLPGPVAAWKLGLVWTGATLLFEVALGRAAGHGWERILGDYNLIAGRIWVLVPLWTLLAPRVACGLTGRG